MCETIAELTGKAQLAGVYAEVVAKASWLEAPSRAKRKTANQLAHRVTQ